MIQIIVTYIIIAFCAIYAVYAVYRFFVRVKKEENSKCPGCPISNSCDKKDLVELGKKKKADKQCEHC